MLLKLLSSSQLRGKLYIFLITILAIYGGYMLCAKTFLLDYRYRGKTSDIFMNIKMFKRINKSFEVASTADASTGAAFIKETTPDTMLHSQYYVDKYKDNIPLVWTKEVLKLSPDVWNWWFHLLHRSAEDPYAFIEDFYKAGSMDQDPRKLLPSGTKVYKTCSVVGSSDVILNTNQGELIDKSDAVFRFNNAITKGFEKDVGTKTTHRLMYPESSRANFDYSGYSVVLIPFKVGDIHWLLSATTDGSFLLKTWAPVQRKINTTPQNSSIVHPEFIKYVQQIWVQDTSGKYPSTGIIGVLFALHLCEDLSVHAFGANKNGIWKHYFEKGNVIKAGGTQHDASKEQNVIRTLHKNREIKFFSPDVDPWW